MSDTPTAQEPEVVMNQAAQDELDRREHAVEDYEAEFAAAEKSASEPAPSSDPAEHAEHAHKAAAKKA